jgi:hypothetical protein
LGKVGKEVNWLKAQSEESGQALFNEQGLATLQTDLGQVTLQTDDGLQGAVGAVGLQILTLQGAQGVHGKQADFLAPQSESLALHAGHLKPAQPADGSLSLGKLAPNVSLASPKPGTAPKPSHFPTR